MRKKFVYFVLLPTIIVLIVFYLFIDRWVTAGLEAAGEAMVGARVEIEQLHVTLSPVGIKWVRLQVADANDPWRNMFETGKVQFALNFGQLFRGKYIIETMELNNFILGTKRATDGSLPPSKRSTDTASSSGTSFVSVAKEAVGKTVEQSSPINLDLIKSGINVDSLVKALDIQTLKRIDSLKAQTLAASKQWDATITDFENSKKRLSEVEANLKAINPADLKGIDKITASISTVDNSVKTVNDITNSFNARKSSIEADVSRLSGSVSTLDDVAKEDLRHLMNMAHLPDLNTSGIARLLVGREMYARALTYLHWIDIARSKIPKHAKPEKEQDPPRMKGQNIHYPVERAYPKFWIQKILLSGGTDSASTADYIRAKGEAKNITNDQTVTGTPMTIALEGTQAGRRAMTLGALFDRTKDAAYDEYQASLFGVPLSEFNLGNANFLPTKVTDARLNSSVKVTVPGNQFDLRATLVFTSMKLQFASEPKNKVESLVHDVLKDIRGFTVNLRLWTTGKNVAMALATDLDEQIAAKVKAVVGAEFTKLQNDLKTKLDSKIAEKRKDFDDFYAAKKGAAEKQISAVKAQIDQQTSAMDAKKKELTDRLEREKKGTIDNALKGILKK
jgi:uncharacterized protein (TIGR03545 family)